MTRVGACPLRGLAAAAAIAVMFGLVSGCGGFVSSSMTETVDNPMRGNAVRAGTMLIRNAFVLGPRTDAVIPEGGRAAVYLTLYNAAQGPGQVPAAGARRPVTDRLVAASAGETARSVRIRGGPVEVPPDRLVSVTSNQGALVLRGLTRPLSGGESIELTLRFQRNGTVTFSVPVLPRSGPYATLSPFPESPPPRSGTPSP